TITGVGEYLRERNPNLYVVGVEPRGSAVLSGRELGPHRIQGIGAGFVPPVLNRELLDEVLTVSDDDAIHTAWRAAKRLGLAAGLPAGGRADARLWSCSGWAPLRASRESCGATWWQPATAILRPGTWASSRSSPPGRGSTRCLPIASPMHSTAPGFRCYPGRS